MAKIDAQPDVLVLGEHPATYLAAALLRLKSRLRVLHAVIPEQRVPERLVIVNPALFSLHKMIEPLRRKLQAVSTYGVQFLSDDPAARSEHRDRSIMAHVAVYKHVRAGMMKLAQDQGVETVTPKHLRIHSLDEAGLEIALGKTTIHPKVLVLGGELPTDQQKLLGLPEAWGEGVVHRYSFVKLGGTKWTDLGARPTIPMSLDLKGMLCWGWLLPGEVQMQLAVQQPVETVHALPQAALLRHWEQVLRRHEILKGKREVAVESAESIDLPLAGALAHEGVANRTLLIGPAGGFYSASGEDIYPNCWSAVFAAEVIKKALREPHVQDALQPYRQRWRTTLGDYLRGPQQNLRFLLPLVYRNQVMTTRLAESILLGQSVVR